MVCRAFSGCLHVGAKPPVSRLLLRLLSASLHVQTELALQSNSVFFNLLCTFSFINHFGQHVKLSFINLITPAAHAAMFSVMKQSGYTGAGAIRTECTKYNKIHLFYG